MPQKVLIALPPKMLEQVDYVAMIEHRTRSDLIREALRRYLAAFKANALPGIDMGLLEPAKTLEEKLA
jgi:metal-responsive CopG/Arc/MetJ family transcriptional regulator